MPVEPHEGAELDSPAAAQPRVDEGPGSRSTKKAARKARAVRARPGGLAGEGPGAPGVAEAVATTTKTLTPEQVVAAFGAAIEPVRPSAVYRLSVLIVAVMMVLLPLIYIGLIALVVAGLYYHAVYDVAIFRHMGRGSGASKGALLLYVGPLLAGIMVVGFMLKPLFAWPARREQVHVLEPDAEPLLHAFVAGICESVGARRPRRIEVDCDINASARREGLLLGLFGNALVLRIGLPLVAGLNLKQFAGVLAHEFGHFSQGAGMRLAVVIMSINAWFARVVYERDSWDESLDEWSRSGGNDAYVMILVAMIRFSVWLTRRILWVLMWIGHLVSVALRRQMEYDADRYEARMVGGAVFAETMVQIRLMGLASNGAHGDLQSSWRERRMPDNFPKLVLVNIPQIPKAVVDASHQEVDAGKTGWLDLYPCDKDRMAHAVIEEPGPGIFHLEGPATDVFGNFDALARTVSFDLYKSWLGPEISEQQLYSVADLVETQAGAREGHEAANRIFVGAFGLLTDRLPLPGEYPVAPPDPDTAQQALVQARNDLQASRATHLKTIENADEICKRLWWAEFAIIALKVGMPIKAAELRLQAGTSQAAELGRGQAEAELREIRAASEPFGSTAAQRLTQALAILETDLVVDRVPDGHDRREEARAVYPCVSYLGSHYGELLLPLVIHRSVLIAMASAYESAKDPKPQAVVNGLLMATARLRGLLEEFQLKVSDSIDYPFEHAQEGTTLRSFALPHALPESNDVGGIMQLSEEVINRLHVLYLRSLGRLAVTAELVEQALGLPAIEFAPAEDGKT